MRDEVREARDAWIALRCRLGEPEGFRLLVAELERPLLYYVAKLTGEQDAAPDVLQEIWVRVFRTVRRLREPAALRTWVYRIARGTALNRVRSEATRRRVEQSAAEMAQPETGEEPRFDDVDVAALHEALDELDPKHREVLVFHFLEELSIREIATVVGVPPGTVKSRMHHAKRALRRRLEGRNDGT
jgi:RNA polymerase sigma-70 factor (ECF subfamily)